MGRGNAVVAALLRSPLHGMLSGSTAVVRYSAPRSGRLIDTPVQYARHGDGVVILVGRPEGKRWWRALRGEHELDVLVQGRWLPMRERAVLGAEEPGSVAPLLDAYLARFPKAARAVPGDTREAQVRAAVVVHCRPR